MIDISKLSSNYKIRRLNENNIDIIYNLCQNNTLYYHYWNESPTKDNIIEDLHIAPPSISMNDKYYLGFFDSNNLIAILDLIDGYPSNDYAFIGFFMLDINYQGKHIGTSIYNEIENYLKIYGKTKIQLGVLKDNPQATNFWKSNGFSIIKEKNIDNRMLLVEEKNIAN